MKKFIALLTFVFGASFMAMPALAENSGVSATARVTSKSNMEIDNRVEGLNSLVERVKEMERLSEQEKSAIISTLNSEIENIKNLKTAINASSTSSTTLKADMLAIAKAYRIHALVIPQGRIVASADRIVTIADKLAVLSVKLQARIDAAKASSTDVSAMVTLIADLNAKVADAKVQAQAAVTEVTSLKPDNGDEAVLKSNQVALKDARTKIQVATKDVNVARKDSKNIISALRKISVKAKVEIKTSSSTEDR